MVDIYCEDCDVWMDAKEGENTKCPKCGEVYYLARLE